MGKKGDSESSSLDVDDILGVSSEDEDDIESLKSSKPTSVPAQKPSFLSSNPNPTTTTPAIRENADSLHGAQSTGQKDPFGSFSPSASARPTSAFVLPSSGGGGGGDVPNHATSSRPRPDLNASQPSISSSATSKPNPLSNDFLLSSLGIKPKTSESSPVNQSIPGFDLFGKSGNLATIPSTRGSTLNFPEKNSLAGMEKRSGQDEDIPAFLRQSASSAPAGRRRGPAPSLLSDSTANIINPGAGLDVSGANALNPEARASRFASTASIGPGGGAQPVKKDATSILSFLDSKPAPNALDTHEISPKVEEQIPSLSSREPRSSRFASSVSIGGGALPIKKDATSILSFLDAKPSGKSSDSQPASHPSGDHTASSPEHHVTRPSSPLTKASFLADAPLPPASSKPDIPLPSFLGGGKKQESPAPPKEPETQTFASQSTTIHSIQTLSSSEHTPLIEALRSEIAKQHEELADKSTQIGRLEAEVQNLTSQLISQKVQLQSDHDKMREIHEEKLKLAHAEELIKFERSMLEKNAHIISAAEDAGRVANITLKVESFIEEMTKLSAKWDVSHLTELETREAEVIRREKEIDGMFGEVKELRQGMDLDLKDFHARMIAFSEEREKARNDMIQKQVEIEELRTRIEQEKLNQQQRLSIADSEFDRRNEEWIAEKRRILDNVTLEQAKIETLRKQHELKMQTLLDMESDYHRRMNRERSLLQFENAELQKKRAELNRQEDDLFKQQAALGGQASELESIRMDLESERQVFMKRKPKLDERMREMTKQLHEASMQKSLVDQDTSRVEEMMNAVTRIKQEIQMESNALEQRRIDMAAERIQLARDRAMIVRLTEDEPRGALSNRTQDQRMSLILPEQAQELSSNRQTEQQSAAWAVSSLSKQIAECQRMTEGIKQAWKHSKEVPSPLHRYTMASTVVPPTTTVSKTNTFSLAGIENNAHVETKRFTPIHGNLKTASSTSRLESFLRHVPFREGGDHIETPAGWNSREFRLI